MGRGQIGLVLLAAILVGSTFVEAATISGTVYDGLTLESQKNSIVTINTSPVQTKLSKDGTYSFNVSNGTFILTAEYRENGIVLQRAESEIIVTQDGEYTIDVILLPDLGNVPEEPLPSEEKEWTIWDQLVTGLGGWLFVLVIILAAGGFAIVNVRKHVWKSKKHSLGMSESKDLAEQGKGEKKEEDEHEEKVELDTYAKEIMDHLKRGGNRLTQKELRNMVKIGEAKVSLVVSELESEKLIKKIKRGRANILVLTEKGILLAEKNAAEKNKVVEPNSAD